MEFNFLVPKKFVCYYPLYNGAIFVAIFMACAMLITGVTLIMQVMRMESNDCDKFVWSSAFGFNISAIIYNFIMLLLCAWLLWAVKKGKATVMLIWVIVSSIWVAQKFILIVVTTCVYQTELNKIYGMLTLIFGLISIALYAYLIFVVLGHWLELEDGLL